MSAMVCGRVSASIRRPASVADCVPRCTSCRVEGWPPPKLLAPRPITRPGLPTAGSACGLIDYSATLVVGWMLDERFDLSSGSCRRRQHVINTWRFPRFRVIHAVASHMVRCRRAFPVSAETISTLAIWSIGIDVLPALSGPLQRPGFSRQLFGYDSQLGVGVLAARLE